MNKWDSSWYRESIIPKLASQIERARWYSGKGRDISSIQLVDYGTIGFPPDVVIAIIVVNYRDGGSEIYYLTQQLESANQDALVEGVNSSPYISASLEAIFTGSEIKLENGRLKGTLDGKQEPMVDLPGDIEVVSGEQSNTSMLIGQRLIYKSFRKLNSGENPDYSVCSYLKRKCNFHWVPDTVGKLTLESGGEGYDVGVLTRYVGNSQDGWKVVIDDLRDIIVNFKSGEDGETSEILDRLKARLEKLAQVTAMMHNCFSRDTDDMKFRPEPVNEQDVRVWTEEYAALLENAIESIRAFVERSPEPEAVTGREVLQKKDLFQSFSSSIRKAEALGLYKTRIHGDYHLGQTLVSGGDFYVIDFEGEPMRPLSYRTGKFIPMKDTGGMARSIAYAVDIAFSIAGNPNWGSSFSGALKWDLVNTFLSAYYKSYAPSNPYIPEDSAARQQLLDFYIAEKLLYEVVYEIRNRPGYSWIPLNAMKEL